MQSRMNELMPAEHLRALYHYSVMTSLTLDTLCSVLKLPRQGKKEEVICRLVDSKQMTYAVFLGVAIKEGVSKKILKKIATNAGVPTSRGDDVKSIIDKMAAMAERLLPPQAVASRHASGSALVNGPSMAGERTSFRTAEDASVRVGELARYIFNGNPDAHKWTRKEAHWQQMFQWQLIYHGIVHDREYTLVDHTNNLGAQVRVDFVLHIGNGPLTRVVVEMKRLPRWDERPGQLPFVPKFTKARDEVVNYRRLLRYYHFNVEKCILINFPPDENESGIQFFVVE